MRASNPLFLTQPFNTLWIYLSFALVFSNQVLSSALIFAAMVGRIWGEILAEALYNMIQSYCRSVCCVWWVVSSSSHLAAPASSTTSARPGTGSASPWPSAASPSSPASSSLWTVSRWWPGASGRRRSKEDDFPSLYSLHMPRIYT